MPRLSMYKPEKGNNFKFIDRHISQMFQVGGTDIYLHKYIGPKKPTSGTADQPVYSQVNVTNIQDLLFLENRDRKYDSEIYRIRGIYNVQNIDFNMSQFGLFMDNDIVFMTVHINDFINYIGRKPISGDVLEFPHLRDDFSLGDFDVTLPRYYVIDEVGRASEGFSATWYPHLYRLRLKKITDNQQYADILKVPTGADADSFVGDYDPATTYYPGNIIRYNGTLYTVTTQTTGNVPPNSTYFSIYGGNTLEGILSTRTKELQINDSVLQQAEADAPLSGYETRQFYTLAADPTTGKPLLQTVNTPDLYASTASYSASEVNSRPQRSGYSGYLLGDGFPDNGYEFGHGIQFPASPGKDDYFLRTDFMPNRLFKFDGVRWVKLEDAIRMTMTNNDTRNTQKTSFINNTNYIYNECIATDFVKLQRTAIAFNTTISYPTTALYLVIKFEKQDAINLEIAYTIEDFDNLITDNNGKIRITLPIIDSEQQIIPETGLWKISFCNHREEQRQSLSKALKYKPEADI